MAQPDILTIPFAANAAPETINPIPISREPTDPAQQATWSEGFPRVTMQSIATGGIPPKGQDMNGALKAISEHIVYMGSGGLYRWSDAWVAAKGGYPLGAVLQSNDGRSAYVNIVEGNAVNFNTTPSSIGVSWLPFAGNGALSGKVDKTTQVIAGGGLTGGGALEGDRTLAIGTPSTLSGSTANTVTEDSHTHAVAAATESVAGVAAIATTAQAQALASDSVVMTPAKMPAALGIMKGIFRATSNTSWTVPAGVTRVWLSGCGGGGGGGGAGGANANNQGGGGGGGGAGKPIIRQPYTVVPGATLSITIGGAGSGGNGSSAGNTASDGTAGGNTVITGMVGGTVTLNGGGGGGGASSSSSGGNGGLSPTVGFPIGVQGEEGNLEGIPTGNGGDGGGGPFGSAGFGAASTYAVPSPGYDAYGFGCGGGGAGGVYGTGTGAKGGAGAPGIVILEY